jgi:hypothetical protein
MPDLERASQMKYCVVLCILASSLSCGVYPPTLASIAVDRSSPVATVTSYFCSLKGYRVPNAVDLYYTTDSESRASLESLHSFLGGAALMSPRWWHVDVLGARTNGEYAAVLTLEVVSHGKSTFKPEPYFLKRVDGRWLLSRIPTDYRPLIGPEEEGKRELRQLAEWFERESKRLAENQTVSH